MGSYRNGVGAVIGSCVAIFWPGAFIFGFPGVMASYWQELFQVGRGDIGNTLFFILAAVGLLMFFVGKWQERLGTRRMIAIGALICGLDIFLIAFAQSVTVLYLWAFLMGAGSCFIYLPALTAVQRWYPARRGLVSGIVNMTFGMSAAVMAPLFGLLFNAVGYVPMTVGLGVVGLVSGLVAALFTESPESPAAEPSVTEEKGHPPVELAERSITATQSLRTRSFWLLWLTWALQGAAGIAMVTLSTQFGLSKGLTLEHAVVILTAFSLTNGLSRLVTGHLSDAYGRTTVMSSTFFLAGLAYFLLPFLNDTAVIAFAAAIIGTAFGTMFAVSAPLAIDCFGVRHFGAVYGLVFTAYGFVAGPLGPSLSGYILDLTGGSFGHVFGYLGVFCLISSLLVQYVKPPELPRQE